MSVEEQFYFQNWRLSFTIHAFHIHMVCVVAVEGGLAVRTGAHTEAKMRFLPQTVKVIGDGVGVEIIIIT